MSAAAQRMFGWRGSLLFAVFLVGSALSADTTLEEVRHRYIEAMGGRQRLQKMDTVSFRATLSDENGESGRIHVLKKRPNLSRTLLTRPDGARFLQAYDGEMAWQKTEWRDQRVIQPMDPASRLHYVRNAPIENALSDPNAFGATLAYQGVVSLSNGVPTHCVVATFPDGAQNTYYLDTRGYVERKYTHTVFTDGEAHVTTFFPSDYRMVDGILFAFRIVVHTPDDSRLEIRVDSLDLNVGALSALFSMPPEDPVPAVLPPG